MKIIDKLIDRWHILVMAVLILSLSSVTWFQFVLTGIENDATITNLFDLQWSVYKNDKLSKIDSLLSYYALGGEIISDQVAEGQDKWLFYKSKTDGDSISDFEGTGLHTPEEMEQVAQAALNTQEEIEKRGIRFVILVAPNKENVYSEYMPEIYKHAEISRTDILIEYLQNKGVNIVSPKKELLEEHSEHQLYYRYDTHWNQLGAYIGVRDTLQNWNISIPELSDRNISAESINGNYHYGCDDDLAKLVGLRSVFSDETDYEIDGNVPMDWTQFKIEQDNEIISHFHNDNAAVSSGILLVGDSFRSAMVPALKEQFEDVYVVHRLFYSPDMIDDIAPEYMIAEYVERQSYTIADIESLIE